MERRQEDGARLAHPICWGMAVCMAGLVCAIWFRGLVYSEVFHAIEHRRLGTAQKLTQAAPMMVVQQLQDYFRSDGRQLMQHPLFSYREKRHYQDIKVLLQRLERAYNWTIVSCVALALYLAYLVRRAPKNLWTWCAAALRRSALMLIGAIVLMGLGTLDFDAGFVQLHRLIFQNRHWLLPSYAVSIQLFPSQYFYDFVRVYLTLVFATAVLLWGAAWGVGRYAIHPCNRGALSCAS